MAERAPDETDEVPGWQGSERVDGAKVRVSVHRRDGVLITVHAPPGRTFRAYGRVTEALPMLEVCPCCLLPFITVHRAKRIANILAPLVA